MYVVIKNINADNSRDGENHFFYGSLAALVDEHPIEITDRFERVIDTRTFFNNHFSRKKMQYFKNDEIIIYKGEITRSKHSK